MMAELIKDLEEKNALYPQVGGKKLRPEIPGKLSQGN